MKPRIFRTPQKEWAVEFSPYVVQIVPFWTDAVYAVTGWMPWPMYICEAGGMKRRGNIW